MKIKVKLNQKSIDEAIKQIRDYRAKLDVFTELLASRMVDVGISVAKGTIGSPGRFGTHQMERYVTFSKRLEKETHGCTAILVGVGDTIYSRWYVRSSEGTQERTGSINALMAVEFGTAGGALPPQAAFGGHGGKGTNAKYGHENEMEWWIATEIDENGEPTNWRKATAIIPTRPMHNAAIQMAETINMIAAEVAREVFHG